MIRSDSSLRLSAGARVAVRALSSVAGKPVSIPDPQRLVHLQFRRFAGCPICDLHLRTFTRRHAELDAAGLASVAVFHSDAAALRRHGAHELPLAVIADPDKQLYRAYGVESAPRALLDPRVWAAILRAVSEALWRMLVGQARPPALRQPGGRLGLPADFLIAGDGRVLACKYGEHAYDQWSVDELLTLVRAQPARLTDSKLSHPARGAARGGHQARASGMRYDDQGRSVLQRGAQACEQRDWVERREGLVEQDDLGPLQQGTREK